MPCLGVSIPHHSSGSVHLFHSFCSLCSVPCALEKVDVLFMAGYSAVIYPQSADDCKKTILTKGFRGHKHS